MTEQKIQNTKQEVINNITDYLRKQCDYVLMVEVLAEGEAQLLSVLSQAHNEYYMQTARALSIYNDVLQLIRPLAIIEGQINE